MNMKKLIEDIRRGQDPDRVIDKALTEGNDETDEAQMWLDNTEGVYFALQRYMKSIWEKPAFRRRARKNGKAKVIGGASVKRFFIDWFGPSGPEGMTAKDVSKVKWDEIAADMSEIYMDSNPLPDEA